MPLVEVEGLSKKFCKDLKASLWYGIKDLVSGYTGNKSDRILRPKEFWAVKDINFELKRGECLGLIGHNGAGKSTLLKILNGLINPDEGKVVMRGRVAALIELGAGFNPILTGRENIYNNGAVLGFTRKEIDQKLESIIDFSELREFIDMPVQNYSSGMKVRLGFAVAAQMEPDILIIDEVLAVGDIGFVTKCFRTIDKLIPNTCVIFVSHSMPQVSRICSDVILMDRGVAKYSGKNVSKAIDLYYQRFITGDSKIVFTDNQVTVNNIEFEDVEKINGVAQIMYNSNALIKLDLEIGTGYIPSLSMNIYDKEQRPVVHIDMKDFKSEPFSSNRITYEIKLPKIQLSKGLYNVELVIFKEKQKTILYRARQVLEFQVLHSMEIWQPYLIEADVSCYENDLNYNSQNL